ncbi:MAG: hypothetical protein J0I11_01455 [Actinobacteria bacterium]|nr:hypothetical protein [Actinomycetota bacterium]
MAPAAGVIVIRAGWIDAAALLIGGVLSIVVVVELADACPVGIVGSVVGGTVIVVVTAPVPPTEHAVNAAVAVRPIPPSRTCRREMLVMASLLCIGTGSGGSGVNGKQASPFVADHYHYP